MTLSANIANALVAQAAYRAEIEATEQLIDLQKRQIQLAEVQAKAGTATYASVLSLQSQLDSYPATIPQLKQRLDETDNLLADITGHTPAEWKAPEIELVEISLLSNLPLSLPSNLTRQRPDVLVAEAALYAASTNVGVATAEMLPNFTLNGDCGVNNSSLAHLGAGNATFLGLAGNVTTPVFEGDILWYWDTSATNHKRQFLSGADWGNTIALRVVQPVDLQSERVWLQKLTCAMLVIAYGKNSG